MDSHGYKDPSNSYNHHDEKDYNSDTCINKENKNNGMQHQNIAHPKTSHLFCPHDTCIIFNIVSSSITNLFSNFWNIVHMKFVRCMQINL